MSLDLSPNAIRAKARSLAASVAIIGFIVLLLTLFPKGVHAGVPYSESELRAVETSDEAKIHSLRNEEINQLRVALGMRIGVNRRADLYFRLAELYLEAYRAEFLLEGRSHEKRLASSAPDKFIDRTNSKPYLAKGIKACLEILSFRIPFDKLDQVYYFLGFYYGEMENRPESARYFRQLVDRYPNSVFSGPAAKELGEYWLSKSDFRQALHYFQLALRKSPKESSPPILHKLAWCYYRTRQYEQSIATMKEAVTACGQFGDRFLPLKDECLRDMAVIMTERGQVEEVIRYFQEQSSDKKFLPQVLEKLGKQYERNVELPKAIVVYETLLRTHPDSDEAARVWLKLVELEVKQGRHSSAIHRIQSFTPSGGDEAQAALQNVRVLVRKTATDHHQAYRKKHLRPDLEIAESYYSLFLNHFLKKDDPHHEIPEITMYLAEVKRDLGKSSEEATLYKQVVESKDKRFAKEAGLLWTASLVEALKKAPPNKGPNGGLSDDPSEMEKQFVVASEQLQESMGDTNDSRDSALRVAQVLAGYKNSRPDALKRIRAIIQKWPNSRQALVAAQLLIQLHMENKTAESQTLNDVLKEIRDNQELMAADRSMNHGKLQTVMEEHDEKVKVGTISKFEHEKDYIAAAKGYVDFASTTKDRTLAEKAYSNAVASYLKADDMSDEVLPLVEVWTRRFPRSEKAVEPLRVIATHALIHGKYTVSAHIFERLGTEFREPDSLETSARLYEGAGNFEKAQQEWVDFLERVQDSCPSAGEWPSLSGRSQENAHLDREASHSYRYCAAGPPVFQAECNSRLADLYLRTRIWPRPNRCIRRLPIRQENTEEPALPMQARRPLQTRRDV